MRLSRKTAGMTIAALLTTASALAQTPAQTPPPTQSTATAATQTFAGCLMKESDYRRAHNLGDGAVGGVGLGDEFVLVDAKISAAKGATVPSGASATGSSTPSTIATSASASTCADQGVAYRLTGSDEERLKTLVGRQLEIQGRFKHAADAAAGGTRPDEKLPAEVEILSFREAPGPAPVSEPAVTAPPPVATPPVVTPPPTPPTPPPASRVETPRAQTPPPVTTPAPEPRELPRTASSSALLLLVGVLALSSGVALTIARRRAL